MEKSCRLLPERKGAEVVLATAEPDSTDAAAHMYAHTFTVKNIRIYKPHLDQLVECETYIKARHQLAHVVAIWQ